MEPSWFINGEPSLFYLSSTRVVVRREGEGGKPCELPVIFLLHLLGAPTSQGRRFSRGAVPRWMVASRENSRERQTKAAAAAGSLRGSITGLSIPPVPTPCSPSAGHSWLGFISRNLPNSQSAAAALPSKCWPGIIVPKGLSREGKRDLAVLDQAQALPRL